VLLDAMNRFFDRHLLGKDVAIEQGTVPISDAKN
jgi:hypothetical protein